MYFRRRSGLGALGLLGGIYGWRNRHKIRDFVTDQLESNERLRGIASRFGYGRARTQKEPELIGDETFTEEELKKAV